MEKMENLAQKELVQKLVKEVKLTPPQKKLMQMFGLGYKLIVVNAHRMSGGEFMWIKGDNLGSIQHAGRVYKAYQNLGWKINPVLKKWGIESDPFMSEIRGVIY